MSQTIEVRRTASFETLTVSSTSIGLTAAKIDLDGRAADMAIVTCETDVVRWRSDGQAPTATVGHEIAVGGVLLVYGNAELRAIRFIRKTLDATLMVTFCRLGD